MKLRAWQSKLQVVDGGVHPRGTPTLRPATFWEKVRYSLGLAYKGPQWREISDDENIHRP